MSTLFQASVLVVDDDVDDFVIARDLLTASRQPVYQVEWARTFDEGLARLLGGAFDACIVDYRLGARDGIALIREAVAAGVRVPCILLTGQESEEVDLAGMQAGAFDYLQKSELSAAQLERSVRYAMQQKRVEEQRLQILLEQAAREDAERANRAKDEFLAVLGHELRNPLAALTNAIAVLQSPRADSEAEQRAHRVLSHQAGVMKRLIDDLLDVSRLTHGKLQVSREHLDLRPIAHRALDTVRGQIAERQQTLDVDIAPGELRVSGDATRLEQVLVNLLLNATKFTGVGGRIALSIAPDDGAVVIRVADNGVGMSPAMLERACDLFAQHDHPHAAGGGLGLGLTLVKRIMELHSGSVAAESAGRGLGTTLVARLPLDATAPAMPVEPVAEVVRADAPPYSVLVVDDHRDAAETLSLMLRAHGVRVYVAHSGEEGEKVFERERPDAVILDVGLPDIDGLELAGRLRELRGSGSLAIVAVSGYGDAHVRERAESVGVDAYFVKPADFEAIIETLDRTLQGA
jgi:signal transduction histidine kinase